jgi:hypothetical protein
MNMDPNMNMNTNTTTTAEAAAHAAAIGLWQYSPSLIGAVVGASVFGILTGAHGWMFWKSRTKMCIPFIVGAFSTSHVSLLLLVLSVC